VSDTLATLRGRIAAFSRAALPNQPRFTEAARRALSGKFERLALAMGPCDGAELDRRVSALKSAHYSRLSLASAKARRRRTQNTTPDRVSGKTLRERASKDQADAITLRR